MTFTEMEVWAERIKEPTELDKKAYATLRVLGRKMGFYEWWYLIPPEIKEDIFKELKEAISIGDAPLPSSLAK